MGRRREVPDRGLLDRLGRALREPMDIASLAVFRIGFGVVLAWHFVADLRNGLLKLHYEDPIFFFTYLGFDWVRPWPDPGMRIHYAAMAVLALAIALGLGYRLAAGLFTAGFAYILLLDQARYQNHLYMTVLLGLLLSVIPAHRALSVDARRRSRWRSDTVPAWGVWLLRFQIGVVYFFGGVAKINADWLLRGEPIATWLREGTAGPLRLEVFKTPWAGYAFAWGGFLLDLLIVPALLWRRTRIPAFLVGTAFHLTNSQLFRISYFPWLMILATTIFLAPDWPRRVGLLGPRRGGRRTAAEPAPSGWKRRSAAAALGLYVALQLLLPLRHLLYPGNVDWTEEGHRFAWRMKLRDKRGELRLMVIDHATRRIVPYDAARDLTERQHQLMLHTPEMVLQFSHEVALGLQARTGDPVDVRVVSSISLNGRPAQALIDPEVNLAERSRGWRHADWIVPLKELN